MATNFDVRLEALTGRGAHAFAVAQMECDPIVPSDTRTFYLETFGCQMNAHDSEKVAGLLLSRGYRQVETPAEAQLVLYNTCSIREKAAQKVFARLGDMKIMQGTGKWIGVLGCLAQQEGEEIFERAPWVSLVCGSASYRNLPALLGELEGGNRRVAGLDTDTDETFETELTRRDNPIRAYITIIEGCDKSCAYCVVPFTRGPERSRASASVLEEVRQLAGSGFTEIQFLGQTVNSYRDPSQRRMTFAELLVAAANVPGIRRVRFTTSHPRDFSKDIVEAIDSVPQLCDHVHLPVQSGSTRILRAMRRTYTRDEYFSIVELLKSARRPISLTTDIIVGFPGESDSDFEDTLTLMDSVQYDGAFTFAFSPRPNTDAQHLPDAVPEEVKSARLAVLMQRQRDIQQARNDALVGASFEVLADGVSRREGQWAGRTSSNRLVNFTSAGALRLGEYVQVRIARAGANSLTGERIV